jgi:hypothetical protein
MQYSPLVYSRTFQRNADYRVIVTPSKDFCPIPTLHEFVKFSKAVINVDNPLYGFIETQRWSVFKHGDFLLIGVGIMNHSINGLETIYYTDAYGRPIRSFIGIVINLGGETEKTILFKLWRSELFIAKIFKDHIVPRWEEEPAQTIEIPSNLLLQLLSTTVPNTNPYPIINDLNKKTDQIRIYPSNQEINDYIDSNFLFYSLLSSPVNYINLVTNLNNNKHAVECRFMNATTREAKEKRLIPIQVPIERKPDKPASRPLTPKSKTEPTGRSGGGLMGVLSDLWKGIGLFSSSFEEPSENKKEMPQGRELDKQNKTSDAWLKGTETVINTFAESHKNIIVDKQRESKEEKLFNQSTYMENQKTLTEEPIILNAPNQSNLSNEPSQKDGTYTGKNDDLLFQDIIDKLVSIKNAPNVDGTFRKLFNEFVDLLSKQKWAISLNKDEGLLKEINDLLDRYKVPNSK